MLNPALLRDDIITQAHLERMMLMDFNTYDELRNHRFVPFFKYRIDQSGLTIRDKIACFAWVMLETDLILNKKKVRAYEYTKLICVKLGLNPEQVQNYEKLDCRYFN